MKDIIPGIINMLDSEDRNDVLLGQEYFNKLTKDEKDYVVNQLFKNDPDFQKWVVRHTNFNNAGQYYTCRRDMEPNDENQTYTYGYVTLEFEFHGKGKYGK